MAKILLSLNSTHNPKNDMHIITGLYKIAQLQPKFWLCIGYRYSDNYYRVDKIGDGLSSIQIHYSESVGVRRDFSSISGLAIDKGKTKTKTIESSNPVPTNIIIYKEFPKRELREIKKFLKTQKLDCERELKRIQQTQKRVEVIK